MFNLAEVWTTARTVPRFRRTLLRCRDAFDLLGGPQAHDAVVFSVPPLAARHQVVERKRPPPQINLPLDRTRCIARWTARGTSHPSLVASSGMVHGLCQPLLFPFLLKKRQTLLIVIKRSQHDDIFLGGQSESQGNSLDSPPTHLISDPTGCCNRCSRHSRYK